MSLTGYQMQVGEKILCYYTCPIFGRLPHMSKDQQQRSYVRLCVDLRVGS